MSRHLHVQSVTTFVEGRFFSWRTLSSSIINTALTWLSRRQQRQELLDYLAMDHRAAADIGIGRSNLQDWTERPFWRS